MSILLKIMDLAIIELSNAPCFGWFRLTKTVINCFCLRYPRRKFYRRTGRGNSATLRDFRQGVLSKLKAPYFKCEPCLAATVGNEVPAQEASLVRTKCRGYAREGSHPPCKNKSRRKPAFVFGGQGGIRTLGPVKDYLISSQGRYDHFDTCPNECGTDA